MLFLISGAGLLALTNVLVATNLPLQVRVLSGTTAPGQLPPSQSILQAQAGQRAAWRWGICRSSPRSRWPS